VVSQSTDIVVRRLRVQAMGMLTDKVFFIFNSGKIITQNSGPSNAIIYLRCRWYHFNDQFHLGGGLTAWGAGTTRYSANSSSSHTTLMLLSTKHQYFWYWQ
jgi:hypothetical protein